VIGTDGIAFLPRGVRTHWDNVRETDVLLAPERVVVLDQIGLAILSRLNGQATVEEVSEDLAQTYAHPRDVIEPDVME